MLTVLWGASRYPLGSVAGDDVQRAIGEPVEAGGASQMADSRLRLDVDGRDLFTPLPPCPQQSGVTSAAGTRLPDCLPVHGRLGLDRSLSIGNYE